VAGRMLGLHREHARLGALLPLIIRLRRNCRRGARARPDPSVLMRRKEPAATIAWILVLVFMPGLGLTLYLLFGRRECAGRPGASVRLTKR